MYLFTFYTQMSRRRHTRRYEEGDLLLTCKRAGRKRVAVTDLSTRRSFIFRHLLPTQFGSLLACFLAAPWRRALPLACWSWV
jgi:hypothetical protein